MQSRQYHRMPIAEKQAFHRERMREPAVICPVCETHTTATDLLEHLATRCPGQREPNPNSRWVSLSEAMTMGAPRRTIFRWARPGTVRTKGSWRGRLYLQRDIAQHLARRRAGVSATHGTLGQRPC
jgi:hypothetical protein